MKLRRLIIAAHPDDIILGMGGTLLKESEVYDTTVLTLCCGREHEAFNDRLKVDHSNLLKTGCKICQNYWHDLTLDTVSTKNINDLITNKIDMVNPHEIYTINSDKHFEHKIVFDAVMIATRPQYRKDLKVIYSFELPLFTNETSSIINGFEYVNIDHENIEKLEMLAKYKTENISILETESIQLLWGAQTGYPGKQFEKFKLIFRRR